MNTGKKYWIEMKEEENKKNQRFISIHFQRKIHSFFSSRRSCFSFPFAISSCAFVSGHIYPTSVWILSIIQDRVPSTNYPVRALINFQRRIKMTTSEWDKSKWDRRKKQRENEMKTHRVHTAAGKYEIRNWKRPATNWIEQKVDGERDDGHRQRPWRQKRSEKKNRLTLHRKRYR